MNNRHIDPVIKQIGKDVTWTVRLLAVLTVLAVMGALWG